MDILRISKLTIFLSLFCFFVAKPVFAQRNTVRGVVVYSAPWCGGIKLREEIEKRLEEEHTFINSAFLLIDSADSQKTYILRTNNQGQFKLKIPNGTYYVFFTDKITVQEFISIDKNCPIWMKQVLAIFKIPQREAKVNLSLNIGCNPCVPPRL
jgi:hypothetical protein